MNYSGVDLHAYWYAGHFIRQGNNPYFAMASDPTPDYWNPKILGSGEPTEQEFDQHAPHVPVGYIDGKQTLRQPVAQSLIMPPVMTAPITLLLSLTSWISWPTARFIWMVINICLALMIPWIAIKLLPDSNLLDLVDKLLIAFIFYNLYGLRISIAVGQQTLLILFFLLEAMLFSKKNWLLAGIFLGLGLSKYSIALPVFLIILFMRQYKIIMISFAIQLLGILVLSFTQGGSPILTLFAYIKFALFYSSQFGIHIAARLPNNQLLSIIINMILVIFSVSVLILWFYRYKISWNKIGLFSETSLMILSILTLLTLLITYHRVHDIPILIYYLITVYSILLLPDKMLPNPCLRIAAILFYPATIAILIFPTFTAQISNLLHMPTIIYQWLSIVENIITITLVALLGFSLTIIFYLSEFIPSGINPNKDNFEREKITPLINKTVL